SGKDLLPQEVHDRLHVAHAAGDRHDSVVLGKNDAVLAKSTVSTVQAVTCPPELETIALVPVARGLASVGGLPRGRHLDPGCRQQPPSLPLSLLQVEEAELRDVLCSPRDAV